jgi:hypothetical protein
MFKVVNNALKLSQGRILVNRNTTRVRVRHFHQNGYLLNAKSDNKVEIIHHPEENNNSQPTVLDISDEMEDMTMDNQTICLDTMKVFNELKDLGFSEGQSDVIMKLIKENLTINLNKLQNKNLTTMELENELYLFEAAQSELKVETQTSRESSLRNLEMDKYALERLLQVENDELNEYLIMSKNDSQVTINDQISENTLLQKKIKMKIQELDNKISTKINSEIKSETESLRWHTTRNGLLAVLVLVFSLMAGASISRRIKKEEQPTQVILRMIEPEAIDHDDEDEEDQQQKKQQQQQQQQGKPHDTDRKKEQLASLDLELKRDRQD